MMTKKKKKSRTTLGLQWAVFQDWLAEERKRKCIIHTHLLNMTWLTYDWPQNHSVIQQYTILVPTEFLFCLVTASYCFFVFCACWNAHTESWLWGPFPYIPELFWALLTDLLITPSHFLNGRVKAEIRTVITLKDVGREASYLQENASVCACVCLFSCAPPAAAPPSTVIFTVGCWCYGGKEEKNKEEKSIR